MGMGVRDRGIAVVGAGVEALLHAYFLQRFGFEADVFLDDLDFPQAASDELVSTWLGLYQSPEAARITWQGIAEFRDIALDLGAAVIASPLGTMIFERRPEYVEALEQFAESRRANGLLVKFSNQVSHLDIPPFTLAVAKFDQDISISPKRLATQLIESILNRGGRVLRGRSLADLRPMTGYHQAEVNGEVFGYATVVVYREPKEPKSEQVPGNGPDAWLPMTGRYLSFERASHILAKTRPPAANQLVSAILDPIRGFFSKEGNNRRAPWPDAEAHAQDPRVITVGPYQDIFHTVAGAREFAESIRPCADLGRIQVPVCADTALVEQPQSIPWII
ncbi:FAD-dependent oxidoreductase [Pseudomonas plecoglossicida]|uniref:FAD-dependent oxidoreductase n=1 Tax=Pseudomonas plecoglossicida TaxID=70775 RepID=UPI0039776A82